MPISYKNPGDTLHLFLFHMSWTFWEPSFTYTLSLMDHFQDTPERREGNDAYYQITTLSSSGRNIAPSVMSKAS